MFIDKIQLEKEIRSANLFLFNSAKIGNVWVSKEPKLIIITAFFCYKYIYVMFRVQILTHAVQTYERWE